MQPGLSRAIPMAIIGFLFGALLVIVIRGLQGLDPLWEAGPGIVMTAFTTAGFFVWGMGAFNPKMSVHGEAAEEAEAVEEEAEEEAKPGALLSGGIWQVATLLILLIVVLGGFAVLPGGLALTQTAIPYASPTSVGYVPFDLPFGGPQVMVSQLVLLAGLVIWAFVSLLLAAGVFAFVLSFLSRGIADVKMASAGAGAGVAALPSPTPEASEERPMRQTITTAAIFIGVFLVLYLVFYYVAIGLIIPNPDLPPMSWFGMAPSAQLIIISAVNAAVFTVIILRTQLVLNVIGIVAGWLAHQLRRLPNILQ